MSISIPRSCEEIRQGLGHLAGKESDLVSAAACFDLQAPHSLSKVYGISVLASAMSHSISFPAATISMLMEIPSVSMFVFTSDISWATSWSPNRNLELLSGALSAGVNAFDNAVKYGNKILVDVYKEFTNKDSEINEFAKETGFLLFSYKDGKFDAKVGLKKYGEKLDKEIKTLEGKKNSTNKHTENYDKYDKKLKFLEEKKQKFKQFASQGKNLDLYTEVVNNKSDSVKSELGKECLEEQMTANFLASRDDTGNFFASAIKSTVKGRIRSRYKDSRCCDKDNGNRTATIGLKPAT